VEDKVATGADVPSNNPGLPYQFNSENDSHSTISAPVLSRGFTSDLAFVWIHSTEAENVGAYILAGTVKKSEISCFVH
jgi:hypothetical protein